MGCGKRFGLPDNKIGAFDSGNQTEELVNVLIKPALYTMFIAGLIVFLCGVVSHRLGQGEFDWIVTPLTRLAVGC